MIIITSEIKENIQTWIKALRSGNYKQLKSQLHKFENDENYYCCLGVACRVLMKEEDLSYDGADIFGGLPTDQHRAPIWLQSINDDFEEKVGHSLSRLNDTYNYSFDMIADLLEIIYIHEAITNEDVEAGVL